MNVNQTMLLLAIARSTLDNELSTGTKTHDLSVLRELGLITNVKTLTSKGSRVIDIIKLAATTASEGEVREVSVSDGAMDIMTLQSPQRLSGALNRLANLDSLSRGLYPEARKGLTLSEVEGDKARLNGGTFYIVAEADVTLSNAKADDSEEFEAGDIRLAAVNTLIYPSEDTANDVAIGRAKTDVGSRHIVLKAVAMHEVAVPIKSTRL